MSLNSKERSKARSAAYMAKRGLVRVNGRIVSATEATKGSARAPIAKSVPATQAATTAPRAMTDADAVTHHRRESVAAIQSGAAAKGVRAVISEASGRAATASPATPAAPAAPLSADASAGWDIVIAAQRAKLESYTRHAR